ncbi:CBASS oligonucleotide cyclase [Streptomyces sp. NPDC020377]|uniref:CBASS oligonucleotide cyclase n=1 Tax=Streptomyces sp. NPDC020377 TaxID=3365070 RepID=UPI0037996EAF
MPRTAAALFADFRSRLELTDIQASTVADRQNNVRSAVSRHLDVDTDFLTGSYARHTLISPLKQADVDIFTVLHSKYHERGANADLGLMRSALMKTYKTPKVSRNGQAITITFTDFMVDVVPAFNRKGGGYLIPAGGLGKFISTDPKVHESVSSKQNADHGGDLVPLIKMIKAWNRSINRHFRSFHLEVLAWQLFKGVTISNDWSAARFFFEKALLTVRKEVADPAGYGTDVAYYISTEEQFREAESRLTTALGRARRAEEYVRLGNIPSAIDQWRLLFGDYFPAS